MESIWQDIRFAGRMLVRNPGFTAAAVLTLALGIGANSAIFSVVDALMFKPLPVRNPSELVSLAVAGPNAIAHPVSYPAYREYRDLTQVFSGAAAHTLAFVEITPPASAPQRMLATLVSGNYFDLLGVKAALGRTFTRDEAEKRGVGNVVVLDYQYWQRQFAANPSVIGTAVNINGNSFTIIGVAPEKFAGTFGLVRAQAYIPTTAMELLVAGQNILEDRSNEGFRVLARLKPGVSMAQAQAAALVESDRIARDYPDTSKDVRAQIFPEPLARIEPAAAQFLPPVAAVFMALVSLVLLIACANVANLLLSRASGRRKEIAIRAALGASRMRIVRQLLAESTLLALVAGGAGVLVAAGGAKLIASIRIASDLPFVFNFDLDQRVLIFALVIALLTGLIAGLIPSLQASRPNLSDTLKEGGRSTGASSRHWLRDSLVVAQVAVSLVVLISAGLFLRSMQNASKLNLGFATKGRLLLSIDSSLRRYDDAKGKAFFHDLLERIRSLPSVTSASSARFALLGFDGGVKTVMADDYAPPDGQKQQEIFYNTINTDYFSTVGIPIVRGREFSDADKEGGPGVVIVNEAMAERYWPGQDAVGKHLRIDSANNAPLEVIGVAKLAKYLLPAERPLPMLYLPFAQNYVADEVISVHTKGDPLGVLPLIRGQVAALDPEMPMFDVRTMETHIREGKATILFTLGSALVGSFGLIGIVLAAVGLSGVIAFSVSRRTHEIGVRMALGASRAQVLGMVMRKGVVLTAVGLTVGGVIALAFTRSFANLLAGVSPTDGLTFAGVSILLTVVALLATYIPARRATKVDPMEALRYE